MIIMMDRSNLQEEHDGSFNQDVDADCCLPPNFSPGKWDVICQRGKDYFDHGKYH
jgi:hypothetical protein